MLQLSPFSLISQADAHTKILSCSRKQTKTNKQTKQTNKQNKQNNNKKNGHAGAWITFRFSLASMHRCRKQFHFGGGPNVIYTVIAVICTACMNINKVSRVKYWGGPGLPGPLVPTARLIPTKRGHERGMRLGSPSVTS